MTRFSFTAFAALSLVFISTVSAADTGTTTSGTIAPSPVIINQINETPLLLATISVISAKNISLAFNQSIQIDSIRVRIIDQATNESVKVVSITGSTNPMIAIVNMASSLTAGASYVLTITSALSTTDMTINAGIDSIREFSVPVTLSGASFNAPSNPTAVIAATGANNSTSVNKSGSTTGTILLPQDTEALPATGTPTTILIILAAISALSLLLIRKKA